ncbi:MAG TPA: hypothetical protein VF179_29925 [Thermoanaerobaculia bacterium]|nr:hypothetical protein [Thermoanaerobaculia bacterium]
MRSKDDSYIAGRIREIWAKLSKDKQRFLDVVLHAATQKVLGETLANEYLPIRDSAPADAATTQLPQIHIILEAVRLMPDIFLEKASKNPQVAVVPYLADALGSIVEHDSPALLEYSTAYRDLGDSVGATKIEDAGAYSEAYNMWVEKTALYLQECRSTVRAVSFNELTYLWDKPSALNYLATHYLLRRQRGCDSRRIFIYDNTYFDDQVLFRRLFSEICIQEEAGVNVRVCSMERLQEIGKGYSYPLLSFGTYDRFAMGVLVPHATSPVVKIIHSEEQIRDTITILDDIFDHSETSQRWLKKHEAQIDSSVKEFIGSRLEALHHAITSSHLD